MIDGDRLFKELLTTFFWEYIDLLEGKNPTFWYT
jgi:hypothetical protein